MKNIKIVYGTQTGNAFEISQQIKEALNDLETDEYQIVIESLNDYANNLSGICSCDLLVTVVSTTGNGDFPENACRFWRQIRKRTLNKNLLDGLNFVVLGLGDTNYNHFCEPAKRLVKRFHELQAESLMEPTYIDSVMDMEEQVDEWLEEFFEILNKFFF